MVVGGCKYNVYLLCHFDHHLGFLVFLESPDILSGGWRKFFSVLILLSFLSVIEFCKSSQWKKLFWQALEILHLSGFIFSRCLGYFIPHGPCRLPVSLSFTCIYITCISSVLDPQPTYLFSIPSLSLSIFGEKWTFLVPAPDWIHALPGFKLSGSDSPYSQISVTNDGTLGATIFAQYDTAIPMVFPETEHFFWRWWGAMCAESHTTSPCTAHCQSLNST